MMTRVIAFLILIMPMPAFAEPFLLFEPPGALFTLPSAINNRGEVLGSLSDDPRGLSRTFVREQNGSFTTPELGGGGAVNFNDRGQFVGGIAINGRTQSFVANPTSVSGVYAPTIFEPPNAYFSTASGINNAGQIVGNVAFSPLSSAMEGYLRQSDGTIIILPGLGRIEGINDAGMIVGNSNGPYVATPSAIAGQYRVVQFQAGAVVSQVNGINNRGEVVGRAFDDPRISSYTGFLRKPDGTILKDLRMGSDFADVNDAGLIVGNIGADGRLQGLLMTESELTAIPEPATDVLFLTGAMLAMGWRYLLKRTQRRDTDDGVCMSSNLGTGLHISKRVVRYAETLPCRMRAPSGQ